jgi:hypothetical protein
VECHQSTIASTDQQRWSDGHTTAQTHEGWFRNAIRHKPSRSLSVHQLVVTIIDRPCSCDQSQL